MKKTISKLLLFALIGNLYSCLTAGTHGSIKDYNFLVPKNSLQKIAEEVISENPDIQKDTTKNYIVNITDGKNDTISNNRYSDDDNYVTVKISNTINNEVGEFTFQYVGDQKNWDTSKSSSLSIAYAFDEKGNGGSNQNGDLTSNLELRTKLITLFESKFIDRINKKLGQLKLP
jgi:hypothetical protein